MLVVKGGFPVLPSLQAWWPQRESDFVHLLNRVNVLVARACNEEMTTAAAKWAFRVKPHPTLLIDLSIREEDIWRGLNAESCRYQIRRSQAIDHTVLINERTDEAFKLINESIARVGYRRKLSDVEWRQTMAHADVFLLHARGEPIVAHVNLVDHPYRARMLLSATVDRTFAAKPRAIGWLNRSLHWFELRHYKERGIRWYDFGGIVLERESPVYSLTRFKLSFGGQVAHENILWLTADPRLRLGLRAVSNATLLSRDKIARLQKRQ